MSNHSSKRRILLHHQQIHKAEERREKRYQAQVEKRNLYLRRYRAFREDILAMKVNNTASLAWYAIIVAIILAGGWFVL